MVEPIVVPFRHGPFWNFSYLIAFPGTSEAAVIDPAWATDAILQEAVRRSLTISSVLVTHGHSDHINGLRSIVEATGANVFAHESELGGVRAHFEGRVHSVSGGDHMELGHSRISVLPTPGHSDGSISFVAGSCVFTGDALNLAGPGTPGPEPGSVQVLWESTQRLGALPAGTRILPGHDSGPAQHSTIGQERLSNPAFLADSFEAFLAVVERATGRRHRD